MTKTSAIVVHSTTPSTTTDHHGAVDAALTVRGVDCEVTLIPDPCRDGDLWAWGSLAHWADSEACAVLEAADDREELVADICLAVGEAWDAREVPCGTDTSCLTARRLTDGWIVEDEHGGVWTATEAATEEIDAADDPEAAAVRIAFEHDTAYGEWSN